MSYTDVIIPIVEEPVDNSGHGVWMAVWKVWRTVEKRPLLGDGLVVVPMACGEALQTQRRPPHRSATGVGGTRRLGYRQRVVIRKPTNMMPKPIRMFHDPSDGTGSVVFDR